MALFEDKRVIPTGIQHGTLTILAEDGAYEVTTFRIDGEYLDHRHPKKRRVYPRAGRRSQPPRFYHQRHGLAS